MAHRYEERDGIRLPEGFLHDVLWGQYGLFFFVRIQDDLIDGQARWPGLVLAADQLLLASERGFARHLESYPGCWEARRSYLEQTTRTIATVDRLQLSPGQMTVEKLHLHSRVSAIFKTGRQRSPTPRGE